MGRPTHVYMYHQLALQLRAASDPQPGKGPHTSTMHNTGILKYLLYFAWANQRHRQCYIRHTAQFTWRRVQYSMARDNGESFSLSYTGKQGR